MLKSTQIASYPKEYLEMFNTFKDGDGTIRKFINKLEQITRALKKNNLIKNEDEEHKFKGDMFEVLSEIFFTAFHHDERVGVNEYTPVPISDDYGVDAHGINANGHISVVQVKYKSNPKDKITYTDIAKTATSGILDFDLDIKKEKNNIFVFTTSNNMTPQCKHMLEENIVFVSKEIIAQKIDNNVLFWQYAYKKIEQYINN
jgi:hypothetical protein